MLSRRTSQRKLNAILILAFLTTVILFVGLSASLDSIWLKDVDEQVSSLLSDGQIGRSARLFALITLLGSDYVLGVVVLLVSVLLYRSRKTPELIGMLAVGVSTKVLEHGLKLLFQRTRPEQLVPATSLFGDYAFPSGHSLNSAAVYGFILIVIGANVSPTFWKYLMLLTGSLLIVAIGVSRVILKMHWPSDVAGGWFAAGMLLCAVVFLFSIFKGRFDDRLSSAKPG